MVQWAQTETQDVPSEHQETLFHCEGDRALEEVAREVVQSPFLEILKGHLDTVLGNWLYVALPEQGEVGPGDLQSSLPTSASVKPLAGNGPTSHAWALSQAVAVVAG